MEPAGKVALTDQKTTKTLGKILHQKAQWIADKIAQKLLTTRKVVVKGVSKVSDRKTEKRWFHEFDHELWDRPILKKKTNDPKSKSRAKKIFGEGEGRLCRFPPAGT